MNILQVGPINFIRTRVDERDYVGPGVDGVSHSILGCSKALAELGHHVGILTSRYLEFQVPGQPKHVLFGKDRWQEFANLPSNLCFLSTPEKRHTNPFTLSDEWIDRIRSEFGTPDFVHFHDLYIPFQVALARKITRLGWKYIVAPRGTLSPHAQSISRHKKSIANLFFAKRYLNHALAVHALSEDESRYIRAFHPDGRVIIMPNGFDTTAEVFKDQAPEYADGTSREDRILGYIGRMEIGIKGLDLMLDGIERLQREHGRTGLKFVLAGPLNAGRLGCPKSVVDVPIYLSRRVEKMPFPEELVFPGPRFGASKWRLLNSFDIYFQTSRSEGMSNTVVEALAFGKPCLLTEGTNMTELVRTINAGWACDNTAEGIYRLLYTISKANSKEICQKGNNARDFVAKNLTWSVIAEKYISTMESLLNSAS